MNAVPVDLPEDKVYKLVGHDGFTRLIAAFYRRIPADDLLGPMYPAGDMQAAEERLRDFLIFRFGGPPVYIERRGHPRLRMRHAPFAVTRQAKDRWMEIMRAALDEVKLPVEAESVLLPFFEQVATFMINRAE